MKPASLKISQFLAIESLEMDLSGAPIHLLIGPNEAGKSSVRDAIQALLTGGQARGIKKHEEQAAFIREGAKAADLSLTWDDGQVTTYHKTPKSPATTSGPIPDDQVMAAILSDPLHFLSLDDKARREILFRLIPGLNPTETEINLLLVDQVAPTSPEESPSDDTLNKIMEVAKVAKEKGFKEAETEAIVKRRIAKRTRDEAKVEQPAQQVTIGGVLRILPDIQATDVEAGLTTIRTERDKLQQKRGKVEAQADKLPELEKLLENIVPADQPDPDRPVEDFVKALEINKGILEKCRAKVAAMTSGSDPKAFPDTCPVYGVECPSSRKVAVDGTKPQDVDPRVLEKARADLAEQKKEVDLINQDLQAARLVAAVYSDYTKQHQALVDKIAKLKEAQGQAQDTAAIDEQITAMDARMKTGYELLDAVREFWRKKEAADGAAEKLAQADKEVALYDALAKALAPTGIPSQLITEALGPVNERLAMASGYLFPDIGEHVHLTEDLEVYRGTTPFSLLSKSARYRVGIIFQYTLAQLAKARLLLIDEADILSSPNRACLIDFLLAIKDDFDRILVFATSDHADPSPTPDIQIWWIENGNVSQVNERKAA